MTIYDVKVKVLAMLDEIDSSTLLQNIGDYINKMYPIIDSVQKELAFMVCPVKRFAVVTAEDGELTFPSDLYELTKLTDANGNTITLNYKSNKELRNVPDGLYSIEYNGIPATITADVSDDYALEIDEEGCEALIYGVCAGICINDEPELYAIYVNKYNESKQNIVQRKQSHTFVTVSGGLDI